MILEKKRLTQTISFASSFALVLSLVSPAFSYADPVPQRLNLGNAIVGTTQGGETSLQYNVGGTDLVLTTDGPWVDTLVNNQNDKYFMFSSGESPALSAFHVFATGSFVADGYKVRISESAENGWGADMTVDNDSCDASGCELTMDGINYPSAADSLNLSVYQNNNQQQDSFVLDLTQASGWNATDKTATFAVGEVGVVVTVGGTGVSFVASGNAYNATIADYHNMTLSFANFNAETMEARFAGANSYSADITVGSSPVALSTFNFPNGPVALIVGAKNNGGNQQPDPGQNQGSYNGNAFLVWSCSDGSTCLHHFENIPATPADGTSTFYYAGDVKDARTNEAFNVNAQYKGWLLEDGMMAWDQAYRTINNIGQEGDINWANVNPADIVGDPVDMSQWEAAAIEAGCSTDDPRDEFERCVDEYAMNHGKLPTVKLQPLPDEPYEKNAYVSYGDRNFKIAIFNDNYRGVTFGSLDDLHYYPASWSNAFIRTDQFDLSETTKSSPKVIDTVLLEKIVNIRALSAYNNFTIASIEALDVPSRAVTVTKSGDEFKIEFSSNYYDNVVFKVTDTNGNVYYMQIHRVSLSSYVRRENQQTKLMGNLYYELGKTHNDFKVTAKIEYKDGTTKEVAMTAEKNVDDGLGNNMNCQYDCNEETDDPGYDMGVRGRGLMRSVFSYTFANDTEFESVKKIYVDVERAGSTQEVFAGTFTGSGEGVVIELGEKQ